MSRRLADEALTPGEEGNAMSFTAEQRRQIAENIARKAPTIGACFLCGTRQWQLGDGIVNLMLSDQAGDELVSSGRVLPSIPLLCTNCGNTVLLNVFTIGLGDLLGVQSSKAQGEAHDTGVVVEG
jgi:hypothetical protein